MRETSFPVILYTFVACATAKECQTWAVYVVKRQLIGALDLPTCAEHPNQAVLAVDRGVLGGQVCDYQSRRQEEEQSTKLGNHTHVCHDQTRSSDLLVAFHSMVCGRLDVVLTQ